MAEYLTPQLIEKTDNLRKQLNTLLTELNGPEIGNDDSGYHREMSFVSFESWLVTAPIEALQKVSESFGLLPLVYSLSGLDVMNVSMIQQSSKIDLRGHVRYVSLVLAHDIHTVPALVEFGKAIFGDAFNGTADKSINELRSNVISSIISYIINTSDEITYPQALSRLLVLMPM